MNILTSVYCSKKTEFDNRVGIQEMKALSVRKKSRRLVLSHPKRFCPSKVILTMPLVHRYLVVQDGDENRGTVRS